MEKMVSKQMFDVRYKIVRKVALSGKSKMSSLDLDDLTQELYLAIMVADEKKGYLIEDEGLISTICWNKLGRIIHNQYSKIIKKQGHSLNETFSEDGLECSELIPDESASTENKVCGKEVVKSLVSKYKEGTRERDFLNFYLSKAGLREGIKFNTIGSFDGYNKENLAKYLGFRGTSDKTFQKFKKRMIKEIVEVCNG